MNAELAITILLAFTTAVSAFVLVLAVKAINDINYLCEKLDRRIEFIKRLEKEHRVLSMAAEKPELPKRERTVFDDLSDALKEAVKTALKSTKVTVVDNDKPLDFPNDNKE